MVPTDVTLKTCVSSLIPTYGVSINDLIHRTGHSSCAKLSNFPVRQTPQSAENSGKHVSGKLWRLAIYPHKHLLVFSSHTSVAPCALHAPSRGRRLSVLIQPGNDVESSSVWIYRKIHRHKSMRDYEQFTSIKGVKLYYE
ncbi:hypothetical protein BaRGS_00001609 [Batillaria attramentaria]|uniref:Uncharacterized protein n=1 Tax=Batillaria attramentaria TaxID=370345 RepID=A0ABD0M7B1_9CAEN